jgi:hypothetical protein
MTSRQQLNGLKSGGKNEEDPEEEIIDYQSAALDK